MGSSVVCYGVFYYPPLLYLSTWLPSQLLCGRHTWNAYKRERARARAPTQASSTFLLSPFLPHLILLVLPLPGEWEWEREWVGGGSGVGEYSPLSSFKQVEKIASSFSTVRRLR